MSIFREIAFKAELDRHVDPECEYQARILCGEDADTRDHAIKELRNMIDERNECHPPCMDDAFLLRFLRACRFIPARAHRLMVRYCNFRNQYPHLWREVLWYDMSRLGNIFEGVLFDRPDVGRLIICRASPWNVELFPVEDLLRGALLFVEAGTLQPKLQVLGGTLLFDCEGVTLKQMRQLTSPTVAMQMINIMGVAMPLYQRGIHVINCPWYFEKLFYVFKRLAPSDQLWEKFHFHGYDLESLHSHIDPACLPRRYGGCHDTVSLQEWITKIKKYKTKQFDEDMRNLGYAVD